MIINGLDGGEGEEPHALAVGHPRRQESYSRASSIKEEPLDRVVVKGAKGVRDIEPMVTGVEGD